MGKQDRVLVLNQHVDLKHKKLDEAAESCTIDGESPVVKNLKFICFIPSSMGHVESRVNLRGPPRKAKYS